MNLDESVLLVLSLFGAHMPGWLWVVHLAAVQSIESWFAYTHIHSHSLGGFNVGKRLNVNSLYGLVGLHIKSAAQQRTDCVAYGRVLCRFFYLPTPDWERCPIIVD